MPINGKFTSLDTIEDVVEMIDKCISISRIGSSNWESNLSILEHRKLKHLRIGESHMKNSKEAHDSIIETLSIIRDEMLRSSTPSSKSIACGFRDLEESMGEKL